MIETLQIVQNNIIGIVILFIILLNIKPYIKVVPIDQRIFTGMIVSTIAIMIVDVATISLRGISGELIRNIRLSLISIYFILNPLPFFMWTLYVNFKIYEDKKRVKRLFKIAIWPTVINAILAILSIFYGLIFFIDSNNKYNRGSWFLIVAFIYYSYSTYTVIEIIKNKSKLKEKKYYTLLLFILPPVLGGLAQILIPEIKLLWISLSISLVMVFINLQREQLHTDSLTGLYNRRHLESHLKELRSVKNKNNVGMIMIDIDRFKDINDTYGHIEGDKALSYFSDVLKDSFRKDDNIFRYAGDEFIAVIEVRKTEELEKAVSRLRANIEKFNRENTTPYDINVSLGYDMIVESSDVNMKGFVDHVDELMYEEKLKKNKY